jgi:cytochrome c551/c552
MLVVALFGAALGCKQHAGNSAQPAVAGAAPTSNDPRAALFLQKGCPQCHSISAFGVKSTTEVGPDLTYAYADVRNRFSESLEQFLPNPTGTMQMVLTQLIHLTPEERDSVIHILKRLHDERAASGDTLRRESP